MTIAPWLLAAARTGLQSAWGWLAAHVSILALVPEGAAVELILTVVVIGGVTAGLRWLETRKGDGFWPRVARWLAGVLMLGLSSQQPVYARPASVVKVDGRQVQ